MKIQFDNKQSYQLEAIDAVVQCFKGQSANTGSQWSLEAPYLPTASNLVTNAIANQLDISHEQILLNVQAVQQQLQLDVSEALLSIDLPSNDKVSIIPNISVEMETGTGKTYVYLRTIYELNKHYGFTKFVIAVPSVPIREGVLKNLEITQADFKELYGVNANFSVYDSKKLNVLADFARSDVIQILVMSIDAFAGDGTIINQVREQGIKPIEFIQATNPVVIIDEPQKFDTDIRKQALCNLNPLCCLRYSATHRNPYNLIYKLDPVKAYDLGLVKQIEVESIVEEFATSGAFVKIKQFKSAKKSVSVELTVHQQQASGVVKTDVWANVGDDVYQLSKKLDVYKDGYIINTIAKDEGYIDFANGEAVEISTAHDGLTEDVQKAMIAATIERHLIKMNKYKGKGIKVLSLFFIDRVANYRTYDEAGNATKGKFALWFEEILTNLLTVKRYAGLLEGHRVDSLHDGYFSQDKNKRFKDSKETKTEKTSKDDDSAFKLIMQDKERLLDMNTPLGFIFSHSALGIGWDNPNVFQICTLNETVSTDKKRQEIGRGLRLCVNQDGERVTDKDINKLTVIANQSYESFARQLQAEIEEDTGVDFSGRIKDAKKTVPVKLKDKWLHDALFMELWDRIKHKSTYHVTYELDELMTSATQKVINMPAIVQPQLSKSLVNIDIKKTGVKVGDVTSNKNISIGEKKYHIPNFIEIIQDQTELTRANVYKILSESKRLKEVLINPQMFIEGVVKAIKAAILEIEVNNVVYTKLNDQFYDVRMFELGDLERYLDSLVAVNSQQKTLYDHIEIDSDVEREFANACDSIDEILFYIKLPKKFAIKTPVGNYLPDWALIKQDEEGAPRLYFIAETKGDRAAADETFLRIRENWKVKCGEKHFELFKDLVNYRKLSSVKALNTLK